MDRRAETQESSIPVTDANDISKRDIGYIVQIWENCSPAVRATVMIGLGEPVVLIADHVVGTSHEPDALIWALEQVADGVFGFHARLA